MSRSKSLKRRLITPDPKFDSVLVSKLANRVMRDGKKSIALAHIYKAIDLVESATKQNGLEALETAIANIAPSMEVRSRRVGGAAYQVPVPVKNNRASTLAIRWLVTESNKRPNKEYHTYSEKLAAEIVDALSEVGGAVQKKINVHKMAEANKAFAHFKW